MPKRQPEQQMNLTHLANYGAAIHLKRSSVSHKSLLKSIETIRNDPSHKKNICLLKSEGQTTDAE